MRPLAVLLGELQQLSRHAACGERLNHAALYVRRLATGPDDDAAKAGSWMPGWVKSKLPSVLGGTKDTSSIEELTLDAFASGMRQARRLGSLTGMVHGTTAINDPAAKGTLRLFESIVDGMTEGEKGNLASFGSAERQRVAADAGCTTAQVDDCIARYLWMKRMTSKMAELKREGKEMPKSLDEVEQLLGSWRQYKSEAIPAPAGAAGVPLNALGPKGQPCPLAGIEVGRNTKCPLTRKAYKACCGKGRPPAAA